jgi:hypothetical protein
MLLRLQQTMLADTKTPIGQRIAWRAILTMARARRDAAGMPGVEAALDARLQDISRTLASGHEPWGRTLARTLNDRAALTALLDAQKIKPRVPPGMPIGDTAEYGDLP